MPQGLLLDRDGLVHGTPTQAGTWSFWIELSDEDPPSAAWCKPVKSEREFIITVAVPPATVGSAYAVQIRAEGVGTQTWSVGSGALPRGLTLGQNTGMVTGTPSVAWRLPTQAAWRPIAEASRSRSRLRSRVHPKLAFATKRLAPARVGRAYRATVRASGSVSPVTFIALSGRLPIGMRLNTKTGVLSGKPHKSGHVQGHDRGTGRLATDGEADLRPHSPPTHTPASLNTTGSGPIRTGGYPASLARPPRARAPRSCALPAISGSSPHQSLGIPRGRMNAPQGESRERELSGAEARRRRSCVDDHNVSAALRRGDSRPQCGQTVACARICSRQNGHLRKLDWSERYPERIRFTSDRTTQTIPAKTATKHANTTAFKPHRESDSWRPSPRGTSQVPTEQSTNRSDVEAEVRENRRWDALLGSRDWRSAPASQQPRAAPRRGERNRA